MLHSTMEYPVDIVTASRKLAQLFIQRCAEFNVSPMAVCKEAGITTSQYEAWTQSLDPDNASKKISQGEIIRLLRLVHVDIQLTHVVKPKETMSEEDVNAFREMQKRYTA